jgi:hypothetical protein
MPAVARSNWLNRYRVALATGGLVVAWPFVAGVFVLQYDHVTEAIAPLSLLAAVYGVAGMLFLRDVGAGTGTVLAAAGAAALWFGVVTPFTVTLNDCVTNPWELTKICGGTADAAVGALLVGIGVPIVFLSGLVLTPVLRMVGIGR